MEGINNGRLLRLMQDAEFDALITTDRSIEYQQNLTAVGIGLYVLFGQTNDIEDLLVLIPKLLVALRSVAART